MGCVACCDGSFEQMAGTLEFRKTMAEFDALHLTMNEVRKLYYAFKRMDVDNSGSITLAELLGHIDLPRTAYTEKIFSIFDNDGSGAIDFREFVLSVWNYCTLTKLNLGTVITLCRNATPMFVILRPSKPFFRFVCVRSIRHRRQSRVVSFRSDASAPGYLWQERDEEQRTREEVT